MVIKLPKKIQFLLADAARQEIGGKISLMGLYSGDVILLTGTLPKKLEPGQKNLAMPSIVILATIIDGNGKFSSTARLTDPNNATLVSGTMQPIEKLAAAPFNYIMPITPFPITAFGTYRFDLTLKNKKYTYRFEVRHNDPKMKLPTPVESSPPKSVLPTSVNKSKAKQKKPVRR